MTSLPKMTGTTFCYAIIELVSLTGSLITLMVCVGGLIATWQLIRQGTTTFPLPARAITYVFLGYFVVLAVTNALNGPDPERFIEYVLISPFLFLIPLTLQLSVTCPDLP